MPNGQPLYLNGQPQGTAVYPGQTGTVYPGQATGYGVQPQASFPQYITDPNTRMQYTLVPGSTTPTYRGANGQVVTGSQTPGGWVVTFPSGTTQYLSGPPTTGYAAQGQVALPPTITDPTTRAVYTLQQIPGQAPVYINQYGQQLPVYMNPTTGSYTVTYPNGQIYYLGQQTGTVQSYNCQTPIVFLPDPVFFRIDKSVIDRGEWNKIAKAASYLNNNPGVRIVVTGYADRQTAYPAYNLKLSEKRAKTVSKALVERYGINPTRISVHWEGDYVQPFSINEWNRVVIFVIE
jgi:outer membrane protein OmpA-like peptidoglycan-associated protein